MADLAEYVDGLPNICGSEERIRQAIGASRTDPGEGQDVIWGHGRHG